jgi:hypothetical protein
MRLPGRAAIVAALTILIIAPSATAARMQAAGDLTHLVVDTNWLPSYIAGTRMGRILEIAGQPLANSPLC